MNAEFVHLHVHTEYSIVDSVVRIPQLMTKIAQSNMQAVALTDKSNLFGMVKFYKRAMNCGVKPLIGVELLIDDKLDNDEPARLVLLCQNRAGYANLTRLVTRTYLEGQRSGKAVAQRDWLNAETLAGLIVLSGGVHGDVGRAVVARRGDLAKAAMQHWHALLGDRYYLELTRCGHAGENRYLHAAVEFAARTGTGIVASNDVRFIEATDFEAHEARVCINQGRTLGDTSRPRLFTEQQYLRSPEEMAALFSDLPEALANSVEIARRCNLDIRLGESHLPEFPVPAGGSAEEYLREQATLALKKKTVKTESLVAGVDAYEQRLQHELEVIIGMGFAGYFLIVADFIAWASEKAIPVGPGRGSGAGSLVAWVLGITDLDPLRYDLLFERFLNSERVSMPDFDIDFCIDGRDQVIDYVSRRYGPERVSQIITYGTMAAKAVVRDCGRVLGHPYGFVDRIAKLIPFEIGITLQKALDQEKELRELTESDDDVRTIIDLAKSLEGLVRNAGKHAGGVVIAPTELTDFAPLYCEEGGSNVVTQFDKDDVEAAGLVKFDFLGLRTLTIIDRAVKIVNESGQATQPVNIDSLPLDDGETFKLLQSCQTTAIFQLESRGMKDLIKRLRPDEFDDLVALVALFRPGPLQSGMVDDFMDRKHDKSGKTIDYLHPDLKTTLKSTYGVILYQEQVMQIAQILAGYTLGAADLLRRAMGKKKPEEMAKQREIFVSGAEARGVDKRQASSIFDLMEKFAGYGFNKSHSAAYALLSYQTAWLKAHYPAAFLAAVMSTDLDNTDKLVVLKDDCRTLGLNLLAPNVNRSAYEFGVDGERRILYGLGAIKGVGRATVEAIIEERAQNGAFTSLSEFCRRVELEKMNRRTLEAMIRSGALDDLGPNRRTMMDALPEALKSAEQEARARAAGQDDLFGLPQESAPTIEAIPTEVQPLSDWTDAERLAAEKESLGLYLSGHPFHIVRDDASYLTTATIGDIISTKAPETSERNTYGGTRRTAVVAGLIVDIRKRGNRVSVVLDDDSARIEVGLFSEVYEQSRHLLNRDSIVIVEGTLRYDDFSSSWTINATRFSDIDKVIEERARHLVLSINAKGRATETLHLLHDTLINYRNGRCDIAVLYNGDAGSVRLPFGENWQVRATRELREKLALLLGRDAVRLIYSSDKKAA